jgi:hypothetical protein
MFACGRRFLSVTPYQHLNKRESMAIRAASSMPVHTAPTPLVHLRFPGSCIVAGPALGSSWCTITSIG